VTDSHSSRDSDIHRPRTGSKDHYDSDNSSRSDSDSDSEDKSTHKEKQQSEKNQPKGGGGIGNGTSSQLVKDNEQPPDDEQEDVDEGNNNDEIKTDLFHFSAIQIVNRFLETFGDKHVTSTQRLLNIAELFDEDAVISSLKTQKQLLVGQENIRNSFVKTLPMLSECSYRLFLPSQATLSPHMSYCLDLHEPETSPGWSSQNKEVS
jgi:hypothetical protein